jgi:hypothetical protein
LIHIGNVRLPFSLQIRNAHIFYSSLAQCI